MFSFDKFIVDVLFKLFLRMECDIGVMLLRLILGF